MKLIRTVFLLLFFIVALLISSATSFLFSVFDSQEKRQKRFRLSSKRWSKAIIWFSGIPVNVKGVENIPKNEPIVLASNHQGMVDILVYIASLPIDLIFIVKVELFKYPIFGWYLRMCGHIPIERGSKRGAVLMFLNAEKELKKGNNIIIFPEGARTVDGSLGTFKRGSLLLAFKANVNVLPVAISGSFNIMPRGSLVVNAVPVKVSVGKLIRLKTYGSNYDKANEDLYNSIQEMLLALQK